MNEKRALEREISWQGRTVTDIGDDRFQHDVVPLLVADDYRTMQQLVREAAGHIRWLREFAEYWPSTSDIHNAIDAADAFLDKLPSSYTEVTDEQ